MSDAIQLLELEKHIGHNFTDTHLLEMALTHPSYNLNKSASPNYERLEFLGDRVLSLVIADMLFVHFPDEDEGLLARRHAGLVCGDALSNVARKINLGDALFIANSEDKSGARNKSSILENACEALIAALYKDGGLAVARQFIESNWQAMLESFATAPKDPKSELQEWAQGRGHSLPIYSEISRIGDAHNPIFEIKVTVDKHFATAKASSKKQAQKLAAEELLGKLG